MKRIATLARAAATFIAPLATPEFASAQNWRGHDHDGRYDGDRGRDRDHDGRRDGRRGDRRDDRDGRRWDRGQHNGYTYQGRWYYGPPPQAYYGRPGFRPGYQAWQRGGYLPREYRSYVVYDYGRYRLRPPPRGYQWVRVNDDFILEALATGLIADVLLGAGRY